MVHVYGDLRPHRPLKGSRNSQTGHALPGETSHQKTYLAVAVFFILSLAFNACLVAGETFIVHPAVGLDSVTRNEARLYLTMRLNQWPNGLPVQVFVLPDHHALHERVIKGLLGLYPYQLRRAWDRQLFSGTGKAPVTVATESELINRVAKIPGAIGYAEAGSLIPSVRALGVR